MHEHEEEVYYHDHGDGHVHSHPVEPGHPHAHGHVHTQTRAVINRLSRRDCTEVLVQLAAVRSALSSTARVILKDHLEHCVGGGDSADLQALNEAIDKFMG